MLTMARSILLTEIFFKATNARIGASDDSAAVTLMSTDIERITLGFRSLHEIWASVFQVTLAAWLLYNQLGIVFVAPMGVVVICLAGLVILMKFTGDSQRAWMAGVQKRVGLTATVITNMKNLKISGLATTVSDFLQKLRVEELAAGSRYRKIGLIAALFAFIPIMASPPLTFAFAQWTLHVARMFTSLSYLFLLTNPLDQIFISVPQLLSGLACLGRIQAFLECETRHDFREVLTDMRRNPEKARADAASPHNSELGFSHPIVIRDGSFGWEADRFALRNINTRVSKSSLTIVVGPVGSGKSTLCKALLGEIPFSQGSVVLSTRLPHVGFCDQNAFLSNSSIKDNIVGFSPFDNERYTDIIEATALRFDLDRLPQGDRTNVGSDGITLSGGQKQRICLARALYLQSDLLILDDIFSGLDADTEEQVFRQVFGPDGLLRRRRSTVVLCTHSVRHLPVADHIIALEDGTVVEQGSFRDLMSLQGYVQRMGLKSSSDDDISPERTTSEKSEKEPRTQSLPTTTANASSRAPVADADDLRQTGDRTVYEHYFKSMGIFLVVWSFLFVALWGFFSSFPTICEYFVFRTNDGDPNQFGR
jgi:ABC-type multidrug transport system fused ATPase/permease subunit